MTGDELRRALSRPGACAAIASADGLGSPLVVELSDHIRDVYGRLEQAAGPDDALAPLRLAVLVHEESPADLPELLERAGLGDMAPAAVSVIRGFGRLWKLHGDADTANFVRRHSEYLGPLLLFELAHEGAPTSAMRLIARLGGLAGDFERWAARLESHPSP